MRRRLSEETPEHTRIFAAELRSALVAHLTLRSRRWPRRKLLLILKGRHGRNRLELAMKCRRTQLRDGGQVVNADRLGEAITQSVNGADHSLRMVVGLSCPVIKPAVSKDRRFGALNRMQRAGLKKRWLGRLA